MIRHLTNIEDATHSDGLTVLRLRVSGIPAKRFVHNAFSLTLVTMGELRLTVNQADFLLRAGDILYLPDGSAGYIRASVSPVVIHSLSFSSAFLEEHLPEASLESHYRGLLTARPLLLHLDPVQTKRIRKLYTMLRTGGLSTIESFKSEVQMLQFKLLICELSGIHAEHHFMPVYH